MSSMMRSHTILLYPAQDKNHSFVQNVHTVYTTHHCHLVAIYRSYQIGCCGIAVLVFRQPCFV